MFSNRLYRRSARRRALLIFFMLAGLFGSTMLPMPSGVRAVASAHVAAEREAPLSADAGETARARIRAAYGRLPMRFERNQGQFDGRVKYVARGAGVRLWLTGGEAVLALAAGREPEVGSRELTPSDQPARLTPVPATQLRMKLTNAARAARVRGEAELAGRSNYLIGNDPAKWQAGVSNYAKVVYERVYRGIDLVYYGNGRELEYDFKVASGANPAAIGMRFDGARRLRIDANGDLVISTAAGDVRQRRPVAYQETAGRQQAVAARYVIGKGNRVSFRLGRYDRRRPLVIDPVLVYSTFLGGNEYDVANAIAVDAAGNAYVTGYTYADDFPTVGAFQPLASIISNVFVAKLNATGTALVYSTYLGGNSDEAGNGIAVDDGGNAYVTGMTYSDDFPTANPIQPNRGGLLNDAFITKLNATGTGLVYSTYLGGTAADEGLAVTIDTTGNAYVGGRTRSSNFPTVNSLQTTYGGYNFDAFVAKLNAAGTALVYSTYLGGIGDDGVYGIAADAAGNAYVTGQTSSANFPTVTPLQPAFHGKTVFRSTNGGAGWSSLNTGLPAHLQVKSIAIDPLTPTTLYAGTIGGVYKTTDGGANWNAVYSGAANSVAIDPTNPLKVYAGGQGVARSTDGGATWASSPANVINAVVVDPLTPTTLYAGSNTRGVFKSIDSGVTWASAPWPLNIDSIQAITVDPTSPSAIYFGTAGPVTAGINRSTDGGGSWQELLPSHVSINTIAVDPTSSALIYAGSSNGYLYKTTDGGKNWAFLDHRASLGLLFKLVIDPLTPSHLYAATSRGVFKSTDGGAQWNAVNNGMTSFSAQTLAIDAAGTLYTGTSVAPDAFVAKLNTSGQALSYSTYLGGDNRDTALGVAADSAGNAYVTGYTVSRNFPVASALKPALNEDNGDLFIAKLNPSGTGLVYSTYFGGSQGEAAYAIALDAAGNVYVTGGTFSTDLPVTDPARVYADGGDAFVTELSATGGAMIYSTYLGGHTGTSNGQDEGHGIAVDAAGNVYVAGLTGSTDFPTTPGALQMSLHSYADAFVVKKQSCTPGLSTTSAAFPAEGGNGSVSVTTAGVCNWQVASSADWVLLTSSDQGSGNDTVTFEVRENPDERYRTATLIIGGQPFTINQAGAGGGGCQIGVSPISASYSAGGGSGSFNVVAEEGCVWAAHASASWVTITSADNGIGAGAISYTVGPNPGSTARKATIVIGNQSFAIKQKGN